MLACSIRYQTSCQIIVFSPSPNTDFVGASVATWLTGLSLSLLYVCTAYNECPYTESLSSSTREGALFEKLIRHVFFFFLVRHRRHCQHRWSDCLVMDRALSCSILFASCLPMYLDLVIFLISSGPLVAHLEMPTSYPATD